MLLVAPVHCIAYLFPVLTAHVGGKAMVILTSTGAARMEPISGVLVIVVSHNSL